jgi:hypothetical protein
MLQDMWDLQNVLHETLDAHPQVPNTRSFLLAISSQFLLGQTTGKYDDYVPIIHLKTYEPPGKMTRMKNV